MAYKRFPTNEIKGFTPGVDPTVSESIFALNGENYAFDSLGPASRFGNRIVSGIPIAGAQNVQAFRLRLRTGDRVFQCDSHGVWEWREDLGTYRAIYLTPDTSSSPYRWTHGYLNGYFFMAHPTVGILAYNVETDVCVPHSRIGIGTPLEVIAIAVNNGRLVAIGPDVFSWSVPSNGLSFAPDLGGGGAQVISDRVPGNPIALSTYAGGCLTWTSGGVMRSEFTGDSIVWSHKALNTEYRPVNSFCTANLDDNTIVILDERGLFKSTGEAPQPFAPLFNEFLIGYIRKNKLKEGNNLRLEWDELARQVYISVSLSYANPLYEKCFVYYPPLDKWGQFNEPHYGILPIKLQNSERAGDYFGFVDSKKLVRYWQETGSREVDPRDSAQAVNWWQPVDQIPVFYDEEIQGLTANSVIGFDSQTTITTSIAGYYAPNGFRVDPVITGLGAKIQFGLFRFSGDQSSDEMSEVINLLIRSVESGDEDQLSEDYNLVPDSGEDYNLLTGQEDFGLGNQNYINHKLRVIGTIDGRTEFQSQVPSLVGFVKAGRFFSCSVVGVWHILEVAAEDIGETFHLHTVELTATYHGRLL